MFLVFWKLYTSILVGYQVLNQYPMFVSCFKCWSVLSSMEVTAKREEEITNILALLIGLSKSWILFYSKVYLDILISLLSIFLIISSIHNILCWSNIWQSATKETLYLFVMVGRQVWCFISRVVYIISWQMKGELGNWLIVNVWIF